MRFAANGSDFLGEIDKQRPFVKMHGLQNHFVIMDQRFTAITLECHDIVRICDPFVGIGGEQLLTIEHPSKGGADAGASAAMRIFNVDGKEVCACGNATRCMAQLLLDETGSDCVRIETAAGIVQCSRAGNRAHALASDTSFRCQWNACACRRCRSGGCAAMTTRNPGALL